MTVAVTPDGWNADRGCRCGRRYRLATSSASKSLARGPRGTKDCRYEHEPQHPLPPGPPRQPPIHTWEVKQWNEYANGSPAWTCIATPWWPVVRSNNLTGPSRWRSRRLGLPRVWLSP